VISEMMGAFTVMPLKCNHCGGELPPMGRAVTFRCPACFRYLALTADGLRPITVQRALPPEGSGGETESEPVFLPFWVTAIDTGDMRDQFDRLLLQPRGATGAVPVSGLLACNAPPFGTASGSVSAELDLILRRIESAGSYLVHIPAFYSINMYAYLKIGRLLTRRQPRYRVERSSGLGDTVMCALQADEALPLIDFIFLATLPAEIQANGDFLKQIHLRPSGHPRLIEFPFERRGASLLCLIGGFAVSARLVEGLRPQDGAEPR
jgi:hypothetical protein